MKGRYGLPASIRTPAVALVLLLVAFTSAFAQTGRISGKVADAKTGEPLPFANVVILGTKPLLGAMTLNDGTFTIVGVPVGTHTLKCMMMGYTAVEKPGIAVNAGQTAETNFQLEEAVVGRTQEIVVEAEIPQVDVTSSTTTGRVSSEQLKELPVDDVVSAVALKSGIVKTGDELHVRGGPSRAAPVRSAQLWLTA